MHNVVSKVVGDKLMLEIDISPAAIAAAPSSKTGTTKLLASRSAPLEFMDGARLSINVMIPR